MHETREVGGGQITQGFVNQGEGMDFILSVLARFGEFCEGEDIF